MYLPQADVHAASSDPIDHARHRNLCDFLSLVGGETGTSRVEDVGVAFDRLRGGVANGAESRACAGGDSWAVVPTFMPVPGTNLSLSHTHTHTHTHATHTP